MVAIFTGLGAGFERGSPAQIGVGGLLGSSSLGRASEGVFLNAATGNLVLSRRDEFLVGRGPDVAIARTYNSLGALDDNGDNIMAALPDIIGQTMGEAIAGAITRDPFAGTEAQGDAEYGVEDSVVGGIAKEKPGGKLPDVSQVIERLRNTSARSGLRSGVRAGLRAIPIIGLLVEWFVEPDPAGGSRERLQIDEFGDDIEFRKVSAESQWGIHRRIEGGDWEFIGDASEGNDGIVTIVDFDGVQESLGRELPFNTFVLDRTAAGEVKVGFGVSVQDETERQILNDGIGQNWSADRINAAILAHRATFTYRTENGRLDLGAAARRFADLVATNRSWGWDTHFADRYTIAEQGQIRREAIDRGWVPTVPYKEGTRYVDFEAAGLIMRIDHLPRELWGATPARQKSWLNARLPGGQPAGAVWHHSEIEGRMELVPFGVHNMYPHEGGQSTWARRARR